MFGDARVFSSSRPHERKNHVKLAFEQRLEQATLDCFLQITAAPANPFQCELAHWNRVRFDVVGQLNQRLLSPIDPGTDGPARKDSLRTSNLKLDAFQTWHGCGFSRLA